MTLQIIWDDECGLCDRVVRKFRALYEARGFEFVPMRVWLSSLSPQERARMTANEMRVVLHDKTVMGGAKAVAYLMRRVWWMWPAGVAGRLPIVRSVAKRLYEDVARRRYQIGGTCKMHGRESCNAKSESVASGQTAGRVR